MVSREKEEEEQEDVKVTAPVLCMGCPKGSLNSGHPTPIPSHKFQVKI